MASYEKNVQLSNNAEETFFLIKNLITRSLSHINRLKWKTLRNLLHLKEVAVVEQVLSRES